MEQTYKERTQRERRERLQVFFSKQEWGDLEEEVFKPIENNADIKLKSVNCANRDLFVVKCIAMQEIRVAVDEIRMMQLRKKEKK